MNGRRGRKAKGGGGKRRVDIHMKDGERTEIRTRNVRREGLGTKIEKVREQHGGGRDG